MVRLTEIELQGFRSFGRSVQKIDLNAPICAIKGGNSQGKSSLAEAFEFALTGQIARREVAGGSKDEFCDSLRNAHLEVDEEAWVALSYIGTDGRPHRLRRVLKQDYGRGQQTSCQTELWVDDVQATEEALLQTGLRLSHPPMRAPVLGQHSLAHIFSTAPAERAAYFRAMLDTQDLEDFRSAVAALPQHLPAVSNPLKAAFDKVEISLGSLDRVRKARTRDEIDGQLSFTILSALGASPADETHLPSLAQAVTLMEQELQARREQAFPMALFARQTFVVPPDATPLKPVLDAFLENRAQVDEEARRLSDLFRAALLVTHEHEGLSEFDCPLCGEPTLTNARLAFVRSAVASSSGYADALKSLEEALRLKIAYLSQAAAAALNALPAFAKLSKKKRVEAGFSLRAMAALVGRPDLVDRWLEAAARLIRSTRRYQRNCNAVSDQLQQGLAAPDSWSSSDQLPHHFARLSQSFSDLDAARSSYEEPVRSLFEVLKLVIDQGAATTAWEELVIIGSRPDDLESLVASFAQREAQIRSLEVALKAIDRASGKVTDDKFHALSGHVKDWWEALRPDELTFFDAVQRRSERARRAIDLRVGLATNDDLSDTQLRDAVGVLSQSQLHCLGLSLFLARAVADRTGFIVLDDPVLSSDDDFRPNFASTVLEKLHQLGLQVILLTQVNSTWKDVGQRWSHIGARQFILLRQEARVGTEVRGQNDDLAAMFSTAQALVRSQEPAQRKEGATRLREIIERFGKELLVKEKRAAGDGLASITDYDGSSFGSYSAKVLSLLNVDPSHPGKLQAAYTYVTPGPHDDSPPTQTELKVALGDLRKLVKTYLA